MSLTLLLSLLLMPSRVLVLSSAVSPSPFVCGVDCDGLVVGIDVDC